MASVTAVCLMYIGAMITKVLYFKSVNWVVDTLQCGFGTALVLPVMQVFLCVLPKHHVWVAGWLTMVSVYRTLSPLSRHCTACSHREFLDLSDRIPSSPTLRSFSWNENPDNEWSQTGGNPDYIHNYRIFHWMVVFEQKHRYSVMYDSAGAQGGNWLCGKTILGRGENKYPKALCHAVCAVCVASLSGIGFLTAQTHHLHVDGEKKKKQDFKLSAEWLSCWLT